MNGQQMSRGQQGPGKNQEQPQSCVDLKRLLGSVKNMKELFKDPERLNELISKIDRFTSDINKDVATSQIRKFYERVRKLEQEVRQAETRDSAEIRRRLILLKPLLAYAVGRNKKISCLAEVIFDAIDRTKDEEDFKSFVEFFQAIVAYHRFHGGK
ncbi:MAG: type III-A CRISPR-associated protein Csm2 [candidate division WOR-3 bacterium]